MPRKVKRRPIYFGTIRGHYRTFSAPKTELRFQPHPVLAYPFYQDRLSPLPPILSNPLLERHTGIYHMLSSESDPRTLVPGEAGRLSSPIPSREYSYFSTADRQGIRYSYYSNFACPILSGGRFLLTASQHQLHYDNSTNFYFCLVR